MKRGDLVKAINLNEKDTRIVGEVNGQITISIYKGEFKGHPNFLIQSDHCVSHIADIIEDTLISY